ADLSTVRNGSLTDWYGFRRLGLVRIPRCGRGLGSSPAGYLSSTQASGWTGQPHGDKQRVVRRWPPVRLWFPRPGASMVTTARRAQAPPSQGGYRMLRRLLMVGLVTAGLVTIGAPAFAAPPVTTTTHTKNFVETFVDVVPSCSEDGPLYTITTTSNSVEHSTIFDDGREHGTFTQTGTAVGVPLDPSLPSFTAKFTAWGGFNANGATVNGTFTFNVNGTLSDGSKFSTHQVEHFNVRPD